MASITLPTNINIPGPWLLSAQSLKELDDLIDSCVESMREQRERTIEAKLAIQQNDQNEKEASRRAVAENYPLNINQRVVTVYLSGGRTARGPRFSDLTTLAHTQDERPRGFRLRAVVATNSIEINLSSWSDGSLTIDVKSDDEDFAQELLGKIQNWSSELQPRKWLYRWSHLQMLPYLVLGPIFVLNIGAIYYALTSQTKYGPSATLQRAQELARQGVTSANEAKAVELLLLLEIGSDPRQPIVVRNHVAPWVWMLMLASDFILFAMLFPPKGAIGLWAGRRSVDAQKRWIKTVTITIPGLILTTLLMPLVGHLLGFY